LVNSSFACARNALTVTHTYTHNSSQRSHFANYKKVQENKKQNVNMTQVNKKRCTPSKAHVYTF